MTINDIVAGLKRIRARAEVSGEADFWVTANDAINLLDQISCDDCVRREDTTCKLVRELPYDYDIHDIARTVDELVGVVNKLLEQQSEGEKHDK